MKPALVFLLLVLFVPLSAQDLKQLDAYYARAQKEWGVPGMSIAIVKDGKIIFARGYGLKENGKDEKVDENTLFAIASNSKAFTAFAIGQQVEKGKLKWDDAVKLHLPYFELADAWTTGQTTLRDVLSHRVGLETFSGDLIWYRSRLSAEEIIRRIRYLPPSYSFRAGYGYSNVSFIAAGEVLRKITGRPWGEVIRTNIFQPVGMTRSITTSKELEKMGNYAMPHRLDSGKHFAIPWEDWETIGAMGGIISSAKDMSHWMMLNLNRGVWNKDTLLKKESLNLMWTPHNAFPVDHFNPKATGHFSAYGLGWFLNDYHGRFRIGHTGGYTGMLSAVAMLPEEKLGVVVLTNGMVPVYSALVNYTLDAFLKVPVRDWSRENLERYRNSLPKDTRIEDRKKARVMDTSPSLALSKYAGVYFTPTYGKITVTEVGGKLKISFEHSPDLAAALEHWHFDTFQLKWENQEMLAWFSFGTVRFVTDNNANVTGIAFDVPNDDFIFTEMNASKL